MQRVYTVDDLPEGCLDASSVFVAEHLPAIRAFLAMEETGALAIVLPPAGPACDDWRTAMARDLAREYAPRRVNIASGPSGNALDATLAYLGNAPGVTGQYCQTHE